MDIGSIDAQRRHWYEDPQFAAQLGDPSARAIVEGRWRVFEAAIRTWHAAYTSAAEHPGRPLEVLDAGCGDGINLLGLSRIFKSLGLTAVLHGMDYNEIRVARARELGVAESLAVGALDRIARPDASLDMVLLNHVLEHIVDHAPVLGELRRVLRPGGLFIVGVPNEGCALAKLRNHVLQRSVLRTTDHVRFYTAATLGRDLDVAGFAVDRIAAEGFFVPHLRASSLIGRSRAGRSVLGTLGRMMPGQAAGLIAVTRARPRTAG